MKVIMLTCYIYGKFLICSNVQMRMTKIVLSCEITPSYEILLRTIFKLLVICMLASIALFQWME